jgi:hypothetical protein
MTSSNIFGAGVPTEPDVKRMIDKFGVPKEGTLIRYEQIEKVIGIEKATHRFRTVIHAWRKRMHADHNVVFIAVENQGLKAADPSERVTAASGKVRMGFRCIRRGSVIARTTDVVRLDATERRACEKLAEIDAKVLLAGVTAAKRLPSGD